MAENTVIVGIKRELFEAMRMRIPEKARIITAHEKIILLWSAVFKMFKTEKNVVTDAVIIKGVFFCEKNIAHPAVNPAKDSKRKIVPIIGFIKSLL